MELLSPGVYKARTQNLFQYKTDMKISRTNNKISAVLYLILSSCILQICNCQEEKLSRWDLDEDLEAIKNYEALKNFDGDIALPERALCSSSNSVEECEDERDNLIYNMQLRKRQPAHNAALTSALTASKSEKSIRTAPMIQPSQTTPCSCNMEHRLIDLGMLYYPRYVPTAACKQGGCQGGQRCHPKEYKIRVLKQKQMEGVEPMETNPVGFTKILKDLFLSETVPIVVGCECVP